MSATDHELSVYAVNLRRLMAQSGLTLAQVVSATGACERTVKGILSGRTKPHARTLNRIAAGLNVSADEFFQQSVERWMRNKQLTETEVRGKFERLLASDQRDLLIGLVDVLSHSATPNTYRREATLGAGSSIAPAFGLCADSVGIRVGTSERPPPEIRGSGSAPRSAAH
jgi:transcriptional regulator with XRE-family HTH domain